jgi:hypothetical protein
MDANTNTTTTSSPKFPITTIISIIGFLACDNQLLDRKCSNTACKIMFSEKATCPKCGSPAVSLLTKTGAKMCYSEGTFYPQLTKNTKEEYLKAIQKRKNSLYPTYRFKLVSFSDDKGNLMIPAQHPNLKKSSKIQIVLQNHMPILSGFKKEDGTNGVELMFHIFSNYEGDSLKILAGPPAVKTGVNAVGVNANLAVGVGSANPALEQMAANITKILAAANMEPTPENIAMVAAVVKAQSNAPAAAASVGVGTSNATSVDEDEESFYPEGYEAFVEA